MPSFFISLAHVTLHSKVVVNFSFTKFFDVQKSFDKLNLLFSLSIFFRHNFRISNIVTNLMKWFSSLLLVDFGMQFCVISRYIFSTSVYLVVCYCCYFNIFKIINWFDTFMVMLSRKNERVVNSSFIKFAYIFLLFHFTRKEKKLNVYIKKKIEMYYYIHINNNLKQACWNAISCCALKKILFFFW